MNTTAETMTYANITEEQMAAYLDGMLSEEEAAYVEDAIEQDPMLAEIEAGIDSIDTDIIALADDYELPEQCIADDFQLPSIYVDLEPYSPEEYHDTQYDEYGEYNHAEVADDLYSDDLAANGFADDDAEEYTDTAAADDYTL